MAMGGIKINFDGGEEMPTYNLIGNSQIVSKERSDWFTNLFNWLIYQIIGGLLLYIAWFWVLIGEPNFFYDFMQSLDLLPTGVVSTTIVFDQE